MKLAVPSFFLVNLGFEFVDDVKQVQLDYIVLEFVIFVFELSFEAFDVKFGRKKAALGAMVLDIFK